jgi:pimeloyl-ACP methyl ester carboxylesterase
MEGRQMMTHRVVRANGIDIHLTEAGEGPLVLLLHGFPELGYSWRHQLTALAAAGYHAVAPDMRGYGRTDVPADVRQYSMLHLAGDVIGIAAALGHTSFVVAGHDRSSPVAASVGLFRPDMVRGVVLLSVPYMPRGDVDQLTALTMALGPDNYQQYFQQPGVAEKALEADVRATVVSVLVGLSADAPQTHQMHTFDPATLWGDYSGQPLPGWLSEADIDYYTSEFRRTGYAGALNWYRTSKLNWELTAAWHNAPLTARSLFIVGERDWALSLMRQLPGSSMPKTVQLAGCGHWAPQERPDEVNELLLQFLADLPDAG